MLNLTKINQKLIISTTSAIVLLTVSFLVLYSYKFYVRPDLFIAPEILKKETEIKSKNLNLNLVQVQSQYAIVSLNLNSNSNSSDKLKTNLSDNETLNSENPLKDLFKKIADEKVDSSKVYLQDIEEIKSIDPIKFPSELVKTSNVQLQHELTSQQTDSLTRNSNQVSYSLVGLKMNIKNLVSSVYKIENLFSTSGLIGHYYIIEKLDKDTIKPRAQANQIDFSSKEKFINTSNIEFSSSEEFIEGYTVLFSSLSKTGKPATEEDLKRAVVPTSDLNSDKFIINPYIWHYMATKLSSESSFKALSVLVFPTKSVGTKLKPIKYLADVELISKEILNNSKIDQTIFTADLKRILNHCRDSVDSSISI